MLLFVWQASVFAFELFFVATVDVDEQRIIKMINEKCEQEY
jgi:hypothetical protein